MSHTENKVRWCLKKAEKEGTRHRGLVKISPDKELIEAHIRKAEHNLNAVTDFKDIGYSDWSASAAFYATYHCFLALINKFGYESRNQECTLALIYHLIETGQMEMDKDKIEEIHSMDHEERHESPTILELREAEQYGISMSLEDDIFEKLLGLAKTILDQTKNIIEK